jgi:hypothetical protein
MESPIEFRWSSGSGAETTHKIQGFTGLFFEEKKLGPGIQRVLVHGYRGFLYRGTEGFIKGYKGFLFKGCKMAFIQGNKGFLIRGTEGFIKGYRWFLFKGYRGFLFRGTQGSYSVGTEECSYFRN